MFLPLFSLQSLLSLVLFGWLKRGRKSEQSRGSHRQSSPVSTFIFTVAGHFLKWTTGARFFAPCAGGLNYFIQYIFFLVIFFASSSGGADENRKIPASRLCSRHFKRWPAE
jgi:hypothetical protein